MYYRFRDLKVYYDIVGNGDVLLFLHGWGVSSESFTDVIKELKKHYQIVTIDFSGFGLSEEPKMPFTLDYYVDELKALIQYLNLQDITIIAHSFGGRIAISYCSKYQIKKLILVDSAGIRKLKLITFFKIYRYKFLKVVYFIFSKRKFALLKSKSGSSDYQKASVIMKQTMSNIIKVDLKKEIRKIKCRILLFWGYYDTITPMKDALYIHKHHQNSRLIIFFHSGHFPYLDEKHKFIKAIISGGLND